MADVTLADFNVFKPTFVRALGAHDPRPTLARFDVARGVRVMLRDAARAEVTVVLAPVHEAPGEVAQTAATSLDVVGAPGPAHEAWIAAVVRAARDLDANPAWGAFLARAWATGQG